MEGNGNYHVYVRMTGGSVMTVASNCGFYEAVGKAMERWARGGAIHSVSCHGPSECYFWVEGGETGLTTYWYTSAREKDLEHDPLATD